MEVQSAEQIPQTASERDEGIRTPTLFFQGAYSRKLARKAHPKRPFLRKRVRRFSWLPTAAAAAKLTRFRDGKAAYRGAGHSPPRDLALWQGLVR